MDRFVFRDRHYYVKRDDLIDPLLSGNKYRKLYSLIQTPAETYHRIVSYGGTQSNAMLSIAALCQKKEWEFHYTSKPIPQYLKKKPTGNLKMALEMGMQLHEVTADDYEKEVGLLKSKAGDSSLFVPQGGADALAQTGIDQLAKEIHQWQLKNRIEKLNVVTPSGTGTTAYYLAAALPDVAVLTTHSVGDKAYLIQQMEVLGAKPVNLRILQNEKKHHFAKPYAEFFEIYRELKHAGIEFDLIYATHMWHTLLQHVESIEGTLLYVHSGGLIGNETMLDRYHHKGLC
ncbi:D-cysteine desulfhydrase [Mariprofundus micogutta]|uniref:D-cysteine desulfhydrase n=1 Tax=Mariprofundus micogutta TaxID=1921010 RepID=A0A1L8CMQ5_9PROT|nr:D-cysteine desulfhydrase [Mariprofundus micogutta]